MSETDEKKVVEYNYALYANLPKKVISDIKKLSDDIQEKYKTIFGNILITVHPANVPGEMPGKGSNISYACEEARVKLIDMNNIPYKDVIVSALDSDTAIFPDYFLCLTWHFMTAENPYRTSYQPVPFYNNNVWDAPALSRVAASSCTFCIWASSSL